MKTVPRIGTIQWVLASADHPYQNRPDGRAKRTNNHWGQPVFRPRTTAVLRGQMLRDFLCSDTAGADAHDGAKAQTQGRQARFAAVEAVLATKDLFEGGKAQVR